MMAYKLTLKKPTKTYTTNHSNIAIAATILSSTLSSAINRLCEILTIVEMHVVVFLTSYSLAGTRPSANKPIAKHHHASNISIEVVIDVVTTELLKSP